MKKTITLFTIKSNKIRAAIALFSLLFSFHLTAQVFWTENFGTGTCAATQGQFANAYTGVNGPWTISLPSANDPQANVWYVSATEAGMGVGICGDGCGNTAGLTNQTLHIGAHDGVVTDNGASYDAGGSCGFGICVLTDTRAESPTINCTGHVGISVNFLYMQNGQFNVDYSEIEFSTNNGATWTFLATPNQTPLTCAPQGIWTAFSFLLPPACDNNPTVKIAFRWINNDDATGADPSFAVDDITLSTPVSGNTITTGALTGPYCACSTVNVPFSSTGTFNGSNIYKAQLSNAVGSFATPVNIGILNSTANAGIITCTIPCNTPPGSGYLIQVVSSNPAVTGSNNGFNLTISAPDDATFNYSAPSYCQSGANPTPTVNTPGGTFTATPAGLTINAATGQITVATSAINCYNITYTTNGICPNSSTSNICITGNPVATFSYTATPYCTNAANPSPTYSGGGFAGSFTSAPGGLVFLAGGAAGQVDLTASAVGTYNVTNTIAASGGCPPATFTSSITISAVQDATFAYSSNTFCQSGTNPTPVISGTPGGTFTANPGTLVINANSGLINLATSPLGTYSVTYTTPGPNCITSLTVSVTITLAPVATFSYTASPYCQSSPNPSPTFSGGGSAGTFSATPAGLTFVSVTTGVVDLLNSAAGTYTVTNTIAASGGCPQATFPSSITIIATAPANFSYIGSPYCTAGLNPSPTYSNGAGPGGTFTSTPAGLTMNASGAVTLNSSAVGTYTVTNTVTNGGGCPPTVFSSTIQIIAAQSATFSYIGSPYCHNGTNPTPTFSGGGTGGTFSATPPGLIINAGTGLVTLSSSSVGTYTVTNTIAATTSCPAVTATSTITIVAPPTVSVNSGTICAGGTFNFTASGATSYTWSAGATSTGTSTASASPVVTTTYTVTGTTGNCSNTAVSTVTISPPLPVTVNSPTICSGQIATLIAGGATTYTWTAGAISSSTTDSATATPTLTTSYTVTGTTAGCTGTATAIVTVQICVPPVAGFGASPLYLCTNSSGCTTFYDSSSANTTGWLWLFPGGIPSSSNVQNPGQVCYSTTTPGNYTAILTVTNAQGDTNTLVRTQYIHVVAPIQVSISPRNGVGNACEPVELTAFPAGSSYLWGTFFGSISCSTCQTATILPVITEQYWVQYNDINGCSSTDTVMVRDTAVYNYFMPTGIAPEGDIAVNRLLKVHGRGIQYMNLKIFDRVGEKVFETSEYDEKDPKAGTWDGTLHGLPLNENTFVYELSVTYCNGQTVKENGSITLFR